MNKPIKLCIPNYFDEETFEGNRLVLTKTKSLLKEDTNNAKYIASIEKVENYQCSIPEIGEDYQKIATNCFHRDREKEWALPITVSNCKVYEYGWDDQNYHFKIYWIVITDKFMLQLFGFFEPQYSVFYKRHFMTYFQNTEIDTAFDFSQTKAPKELFSFIPVNIPVEELQQRIDDEKQKEEKTKYLEEYLKVSHPNFYAVLEAELKEKEEVNIENFICTDWNMYYDLYHPENFSDPDSTIEWEDNSDVFEYYEKPYTDNSKVTIVCNENDFDFVILKNLIANVKTVEQKLLSFFEQYTFGNSGAYADSIHYQWAKTEIERFHKTTYTNQEFLKQNLCLQDIIITDKRNELKFYFKCSWDTEHGIDIIVDENFKCRIEG